MAAPRMVCFHSKAFHPRPWVALRLVFLFFMQPPADESTHCSRASSNLRSRSVWISGRWPAGMSFDVM
jgi:hypothetical protein